MISRILFALGATIALLPGIAHAEGWSGEFDRSGFYVGVGGLSTQNSLLEDKMSGNLPTNLDLDDAWGMSAQVGYRAFSFLATELEYDYVSPFDVGFGGTKVASIESHLLTTNVKAILPIWRIQPYLMGGVGFMHWGVDNLGGGSDNETDLAGRLGGGVDVHVTERISLNVGTDVVFSDTSLETASDDYLAYVSVGAGLTYRFWGFSGE